MASTRAERAHPDHPRFQHGWAIRWRKGWIPWLHRSSSPYFDALVRRYKWVNRHCMNLDVLDIPCGMGWGTSMLRRAKRVVGIDISEDAINEARTRYGHCATFEVGSMEALAHPNNSFDILCCLEGIEHVPTSIGLSFLKEAARVLRPDGHLFLSSPYCTAGGHSGNPHHVHEYQPAEIREAIERWFLIEEEDSREVDIVTVQYFKARPSKN